MTGTRRGVPFFCLVRVLSIPVEGSAHFALGQSVQADVPVTAFVRAPDEQTRFVSELRGHQVQES